MSSKEVVFAGVDLTPFHTASTSVDIDRAYAYVDSVTHTVDDEEQMYWHGWALREAFLAGMQARDEEECGCEPTGTSEASEAMFKAQKDGKTSAGKMASKEDGDE